MACSSAAWEPRLGFSAVTVGDAVFVVGGFAEQVLFNDCWRSLDGGETWECMARAAPFSRRYDTAFAGAPGEDGQVQLWVAGGFTDSHDYVRDVWHSTDSGETWNLVTLEAEWSGRRGSSLVFRNGELMLLGGSRYVTAALAQSLHGPSARAYWQWFSEVWVSQDMGASWAHLGRTPFSPRVQASLVEDLQSDTLYLVGGITKSPNPPRNDPHARTACCDVWSTRTGRGWELLTDQIPAIDPRLHTIRCGLCTNPEPRLAVLGGGELGMKGLVSVVCWSGVDRPAAKRQAKLTMMIGAGLYRTHGFPADVWRTGVMPYLVLLKPGLWDSLWMPNFLSLGA
mmetsp:Transcript_35343/g.80963  ORF Transcript_35343/g.80963 Transcript_35343/m.80963 type:complete len:340 (+) Transcript_35343:3-1022(+)